MPQRVARLTEHRRDVVAHSAELQRDLTRIDGKIAAYRNLPRRQVDRRGKTPGAGLASTSRPTDWYTPAAPPHSNELR